MIWRLALVAVLGFGAWRWLTHRLKNKHPEAKTLCPCALCGIYVAPEDTVWHNGHPYCSKDHAQIGTHHP